MTNKKIFLSHSSFSGLFYKITLVILDIVFILTAYLFSGFLSGDIISTKLFREYPWLLYTIILIGVPIYIITRQYRALLSYIVSKDIYQVTFRNIAILCLSLIV